MVIFITWTWCVFGWVFFPSKCGCHQ